MKYVKKWNMGMIVATACLATSPTVFASSQGGNSNAEEAHDIQKNAALESGRARDRHGAYYGTTAIICTAAAIWPAASSVCGYTKTGVTLGKAADEFITVKSVEDKVGDWMNRQGFANSGTMVNMGKDAATGSTDLIFGKTKSAEEIIKGTEIAADETKKTLADEITKEANKEAAKESQKTAYVNAIESAAQSFAMYTQAEMFRKMASVEAEEQKKFGPGDGGGGGGGDISNNTNNNFNDGSGNLNGQNQYVAKSDASDPCANITNASQAVNCISKNAAIQRAMNDPALRKGFQEKFGKPIEDVVGNMVAQAAQDPRSLAGNLGNLMAAGSGNADMGRQFAGTLGSAMDQLKSDMDEEAKQIASSKMSDKYKTTNQATGGAGKGAGAAGAGMPNLDMAGMFGDLFGKKPGDKKEARLGKLNFAAARKEKIPGYGSDVWENRNISIFERVENAYQDVTLNQGFDWTSWKLSSNQKAAGSNAKGRMPASSQR